MGLSRQARQSLKKKKIFFKELFCNLELLTLDWASQMAQW